MENRKEILVTGGAGFIGSHTVVELIQNGFDPVIIDDFRNSEEVILEGIERIVKRKIKVYRIDLTDYNKVREVFKVHQFCAVIHFAAYKAVGESVDRPIKYYRNNLNTLLNVAELAIEFNVFEFIFSSSCTLYEVPLDCAAVSEKTPLCEPTSPYASTKKMGERILNDIAKTNPRLKILFLRYFNPIGAHFSGFIGELPQGRPNNLLPYITQTAMGKLQELTVFGNDYDTADGTCIRDYIHVSDIAEAHVAGVQWLMEQLPNTKEVINLGTGQGKSVSEIISLFESITGEKLNWKFGPRRAGDKEQIFANAQKAKKLLRWTSRRSIEEAISSAWKWEMKKGSPSVFICYEKAQQKGTCF
ncbi:MAG: UDP-glucose 4-epimerase GalE [Crocinitomicaceae bacterium]|nr:UDP-glucose 4-epimerase GalE [Crocinitomicaceae bacterium]